MNVLNAVGRVGKDAEQRHTQGGSAVVSFSLAVDSGYGESKKTNWIDCSIWGKQAESTLHQYIRKGDQLGITGEISLESWTTKEGVERQTLRCRVNDVTLISNKSDHTSTNDNSSQSTVYAGSNTPTASDANFTNDSIPF
jgi:single-strand DNA-binding protein